MNETNELDFNPLDEAVNEKRYTQQPMNVEGVDFTRPIEEPSFTPPPFKKSNANSNTFSSSSSANSTSNTNSFEKKSYQKDPVNPDLKNLSKKDTKAAAKAAAKVVISGYEWLHSLGNKFIQIPQRKLIKLQEAGEINLQAMIEYDYGHTITAGEFINEYNSQVSNLLVVSQEFKDEAMPLLEEVFQERGIGITPFQQLMFVFSKDVAAKGLIIYQQKMQVKQMMEHIKEATIRQNIVQQAPPPPPPPPPMDTPKQEREPEERQEAPIRPLRPNQVKVEDKKEDKKDDDIEDIEIFEFKEQYVEPEEKESEQKRRGRPRKNKD